MANIEKPHDNRVVQKEVKNIKYKELSREAKEAINNAIQGCRSLGRNKVDSEEIYEVMRKCEYITRAQTLYTINIMRSTGAITKMQLQGKSQEDKYKTVSKLVSQALELLIVQGIPLKGSMKRVVNQVAGKQLDEQQQKVLDEKVKSGVPINDLIKYLSGLI
ncbi:TPA: hypothetical protein I3798_003549 [Enterobacter cloacae]|uniref:hypothetical protein n=1 Tax=Enterobacteriaceae TaxID=543 RepID=UPI0028D9F088|nr:hypothetical protein [Enterobacter hormaechei]HAS1056437.1 hypothetical protein [Enterobacter cloacae]HCB2376065.1 hypothetical protein [Klebsiella pneumoniae]HAS1066423.1 hypothetical protein [Enterobacter cloacae]HAS1113666.1 hypothetical protein [Enterobacter cloacae]